MAQTGFAQELNSEQQPRNFGGPDAPANRIESDRVATDTLLQLDGLQSWYEWKDKLQSEHGLSFGLEYNAAYLRASDHLPGTDDDAAGGIFRFSGVWEAFARGSSNPGSCIFLLSAPMNLPIRGQAPCLLRVWATSASQTFPTMTKGGDSTRFTGTRSSKMASMKWSVVISISAIMSMSSRLVSPWTDFFNYAHSIGVGALDLTNDASLGFAGATWLTDNVYAMAGFVDQNADGTDPLDGFDTFFNDREYFKHFEIGWTGASKEAYYLNNVHLTLWHSDKREELDIENGWGGVLSFNHTIGDKWLAFARTGWAEDGGSLLERSVSIGGGYTPGGMETLGSGSQLGFALNWGRPNDTLFGQDVDDQYATEIYYRWQLADEIAITPSLQFLDRSGAQPR